MPIDEERPSERQTEQERIEAQVDEDVHGGYGAEGGGWEVYTICDWRVFE